MGTQCSSQKIQVRMNVSVPSSMTSWSAKHPNPNVLPLPLATHHNLMLRSYC